MVFLHYHFTAFGRKKGRTPSDVAFGAGDFAVEDQALASPAYSTL